MPGFSVIPTENGGENMACSDEALVGRIKKGDQAALEELVERTISSMEMTLAE